MLREGFVRGVKYFTIGIQISVILIIGVSLFQLFTGDDFENHKFYMGLAVAEVLLGMMAGLVRYITRTESVNIASNIIVLLVLGIVGLIIARHYIGTDVSVAFGVQAIIYIGVLGSLVTLIKD